MSIRKTLQVLRIKFQVLSRLGFLRAVGVLVGGTAVAQLIAVLALPIITRLYSPADFSVLAVYSAILGIISVVACLRLEIAIPMPENHEDAANLLVLSMCSCTGIAALTAFSVWLFPAHIVGILNQPELEPFLWLLPIGVWVSSAYAAVQLWTTRKKKFVRIAKTRITQSTGGAIVKLGFGWLAAFGPFGLLLGQVVSSGAGFFTLGIAALKDDGVVLRSISFASMRKVFKLYDRFPKYSTFEAFSNAAAVQIPIIIIAAKAVGPDAGHLLLATSAMAVPIGLIGGAVSQVYLSRAPDEMRAGRLAVFTSKIIGGLAKSGVGPLIFIGIISPAIFQLIFGKEWQRAGELVAWMTPWFIAQFLSSPISMTLHVTGNQRTALKLQIFGLVLRVGTVICTGLLAHKYIVEAYAISGLVFYAIYFIVVVRFAGIKFKNLMDGSGPAFKLITFWIVLGTISALVINEINSFYF